MNSAVVVYVVEDDDALRLALGILLEEFGFNARLCASAGEFLNVFNPCVHACLLLDLHMPEINGLELQKIMTEKGINVPTIILTGHGDVTLAVKTIKAGAREFIEKPFDEQILIDTINHVLAEDLPDTSYNHNLELLSNLTKRECEIGMQISEGKRNKQIATTLGISVRTVENHRANIMKKLQIQTTPQLIHLFLTANLSQ